MVGGGRMGEALLSGLIDGGWAPVGELAVVEVAERRRAELARRFPGLVVLPEPPQAEAAVVAVKPADATAACRALRGTGVARVLSIAAGVPAASLQQALGGDVAVVRAMPNTPALIGAGAAAIAPGTTAGPDDMAWAEAVLGAVGTVVRVAEPLLDAVTGLSGSGPAYIFLVVEAMIEAGVLVGLPREVSAELTVQTVLGAARLLAETGDGPEVLRAGVTSPGGTTAAGLRALEAGGVRAAFLDAVENATTRSRELGA